MDKELEAEIQACIGELSESHKSALKELFDSAGVPVVKEKVIRRGIEKDGIYQCTIVIKCTLCRTEVSHTKQSSSPKMSVLEVPTCNSCATVLATMTVEQLVPMTIKAADGMYALVKEAKNAPVEADILTNWGGNKETPE